MPKKEPNARTRTWSLTINQNAECYPNIEKLLSEVEGDYSYILHDKDLWNDQDQLLDKTKISGTPKLNHYHVVIHYVNPKTFGGMKKTFEGAHIEPTKNEQACVEYLIHKNNPEKYQYDVNEVVTNSQKYSNWLLAKSYPYLELNELTTFIVENDVHSILVIISRYGFQVQSKLKTIEIMINEYSHGAEKFVKEMGREDLLPIIEKRKNPKNLVNEDPHKKVARMYRLKAKVNRMTDEAIKELEKEKTHPMDRGELFNK